MTFDVEIGKNSATLAKVTISADPDTLFFLSQILDTFSHNLDAAGRRTRIRQRSVKDLERLQELESRHRRKR
jgi:hypothetical protein